MFVPATLYRDEVLGSLICWVNHLEYAYFSALAIAQDNTYSARSTEIKAGCSMYSIFWTVVCTCDVVGLLQTWVTALSRGEEGFWWSPPSMLRHFIFSKELSILLLTASIFAAEISNHHWTWAPFGEEALSLSPCATHFLRAGPARTVTLRTLLPGFFCNLPTWVSFGVGIINSDLKCIFQEEYFWWFNSRWACTVRCCLNQSF